MISELINERLIRLNLDATSKQAVFNELSQALVDNDRVSDKAAFIADVNAREALGNTGFEAGIALPHAKSDAVTKPGVVIGISRDGIDYGAEDGERSHIFFMIASPTNGGDHHIEVLASLSSKLIEPGFTQALLAANTPSEVMTLLTQPSKESNNTG
ncbi:PTS fructose transporter subunit IIC, partial [Salinivibrio sp. MA427]